MQPRVEGVPFLYGTQSELTLRTRVTCNYPQLWQAGERAEWVLCSRQRTPPSRTAKRSFPRSSTGRERALGVLLGAAPATTLAYGDGVAHGLVESDYRVPSAAPQDGAELPDWRPEAGGRRGSV